MAYTGSQFSFAEQMALYESHYLIPEPDEDKIPYDALLVRPNIFAADYMPIYDGFTTHWTGPLDLRALQYAASKKSMWYDHGKGCVRERKDGSLHVWSNGGGTDWELLVEMNLESDDAMRRRHEWDVELKDGKRVCATPWREASRGEKLRRCRMNRTDYTQLLDLFQERQLLNRALIDAGDDLGGLKANELVYVPQFITILRQYLGLLDEVEKMVLGEVKAGWEWRAGVLAQLEVRKQMGMLHGLLGPLYRKSKRRQI